MSLTLKNERARHVMKLEMNRFTKNEINNGNINRALNLQLKYSLIVVASAEAVAENSNFGCAYTWPN